MKKRALIFSLAYYPHLVGGAEVAVKEITDRISEEDIEFDMITLYAGSSREERIGNINIYRVGPHIKIVGNNIPHISYLVKFQYVAFAFFKSLILERKRKYNFIWSVMVSFNGFSALFFKIIHPSIPFFLNLQEGDSIEHIKKSLGIMYPLYIQIFKKVDYIQAISNFLLNYAKSLGAYCRSSIVPNGVNFEFFSQKPIISQLKALAHEIGLEPTDIVLISTSRLVQKNGYSDVLDSLTYLPENVKFVIVGNGPLEKLLKEKTALLKLEHRVKFIGFVQHKEFPLYLRNAHIFVRPSLSEGMGVSFIEAMAADLPVIATPVGGIPDFLEDGKTGLFCRVGDPQSIAEKVKILIADENLRQSIIKNAREMVREKYDWNLIAGEMKDIFEKL